MEYKEHTFVLKEDGKIYYVNTPEANDFVDQDDISTRFDQAGYDEALQSAIANGIEVEKPVHVFKKIQSTFEVPQVGKPYTLNCKVEVIEEWIPGQGYGSPSKEIARVTFEQPEKKPVFRMPEFDSPKNWKEDYPHENGNYVCTCSICKEQFYGHKRRVVCKVCNEPEAAGQEQESQEELWREAESIVSASLGTYKTSLSDKMAKWAIDELKKQFTITRKKP